MIIYWTMYFVPAIMTIATINKSRFQSRIYTIISILFLFFFVAFRQTGGDYTRYEYLFRLISNESLNFAITQTEPLYGLINWIVQAAGNDFLFVVVITSTVYCFCLWRFVRVEPIPLLALSIATAYLTIVVAMGYTRQGVAVGLVMWSTVAIRDRKPLVASLILIGATGIHFSAAIAFGLVYHAVDFRTKQRAFLFGIVMLSLTALGLYSILNETLNQYFVQYVESDRYASGGAVQRLLLCWVAAFIVIFFRRRWPEKDRALWMSVSLVSLGTGPLLFLSSTVADRVGLYLLPLQIVAFGRLPLFQPKYKGAMIVLVLGGYLLVLGTWLLLGTFASELWLPYRSSILGTIS